MSGVSALDFAIPLGDVGMLWAFGNVGDTTIAAKHPPQQGKGKSYVALCDAGTRPTATTKTTTTTGTATLHGTATGTIFDTAMVDGDMLRVDGGYEGEINFVDASGDIMFHWKPDTARGHVLRSARYNGVWSDPVRAGGLPFKTGQNFSMSFTRSAGGWRVSVGGARAPGFDFDQTRPGTVVKITADVRRPASTRLVFTRRATTPSPRATALLPPSYYHAPPRGLHRIYASCHSADTTANRQPSDPVCGRHNGGHMALPETAFNDDTQWLTPEWSRGSMVLDLGQPTSLAAMRFLNTHHKHFRDRGTNSLRIDVGRPGTARLVRAASISVHGAAPASTRPEQARPSVRPDIVAVVVAGGKARDSTKATPIATFVGVNTGGQGCCRFSSAGFDVLGNGNHDLVPSETTAGGCQALCANDVSCQAFEVSAWQGCELHRATASHATNNPGCTCMVRQHPLVLPTTTTTTSTSTTTTTTTTTTITTTTAATAEATSPPATPGDRVGDGDTGTCITLPARELAAANPGSDFPARVILLDLGGLHSLSAVKISTGGRDLGETLVFAGPSLESVGGAAGTQPWPNTTCNGGRAFVWHPNATTTSPRTQLLALPCAQPANFVAVHALDASVDYTVCEVQPVKQEGESWRTVGRTSLSPTFRLGSMEDGGGVALGKWHTHRLGKPVSTRYVRLTVESYYKRGGGLAVVEAWSDTPAPRVLIRSRPASTAAQPGLLAQLFPFGRISTLSKTWREDLDSVIQNHPPGAEAVVPHVDFVSLYGEYPWEVRQSSSVLIGASGIATTAGKKPTKEVSVVFDTPFAAVPSVDVAVHEKFKAGKMAPYSKGFVLQVLRVERSGFTLSVSREDSSRWDFAEQFGSPPLSVQYSAKSVFAAATTSNSKTTRGWTASYVGRFTGELVASATGKHTVFLVAGPMAS